jgi:UV DNA damage repair endonuclease
MKNKYKIDKTVRLSTLEKLSHNAAMDKIKKIVTSNLLNLSELIREATNQKVGRLQVFNADRMFPLHESPRFGYWISDYLGMLKGIQAQCRDNNLRLVLYPSQTQVHQIEHIVDILDYMGSGDFHKIVVSLSELNKKDYGYLSPNTLNRIITAP